MRLVPEHYLVVELGQKHNNKQDRTKRDHSCSNFLIPTKNSITQGHPKKDTLKAKTHPIQQQIKRTKLHVRYPQKQKNPRKNRPCWSNKSKADNTGTNQVIPTPLFRCPVLRTRGRYVDEEKPTQLPKVATSAGGRGYIGRSINWVLLFLGFL